MFQHSEVPWASQFVLSLWRVHRTEKGRTDICKNNYMGRAPEQKVCLHSCLKGTLTVVPERVERSNIALESFPSGLRFEPSTTSLPSLTLRIPRTSVLFSCGLAGDWAGVAGWSGPASCCVHTPCPSGRESAWELGLDQRLTAVGRNQTQRGPSADLPTGWQ